METSIIAWISVPYCSIILAEMFRVSGKGYLFNFLAFFMRLMCNDIVGR